uniref:Uncharacterized protein n=1 Tax=Timema monikensis TaxID=170555 RepID=A0A7R9EHJ8_9NEOP|nr:unnamed protein product [Timema monikensis]
MDLKEMGCNEVDWLELAGNVAMSYRVPDAIEWEYVMEKQSRISTHHFQRDLSMSESQLDLKPSHSPSCAPLTPESRAKRLFEPVLRTSGLQVRREEETISGFNFTVWFKLCYLWGKEWFPWILTTA